MCGVVGGFAVYRHFFKRVIGLILAIIGLPFFVIVFVIVAPIILMEDRGPVFYNAPRLGKNGKIFKMYKFRSMIVNAPDVRNSDGSTFNSDNDPRVTRIGSLLRKTSLDEIPQLLNVLKGDMSLVGPRPNVPTSPIDQLPEIEKKRLLVRPGITGYNQAFYRNSVTTEEKFKNDVYYVDNLSFLLDIKILVKTVFSVLSRKNINAN